MKSVTLLSTADWDNPFWTNKQHVACELARRGTRVLYVESLGLRRPSLKAQDLRRVWRRLLRGLRPPRPARDNLWVWSPLVIPLQRFAVVRGLNRLLLSAGLALWRRRFGIDRQVLWTYNPMTTRFVNVANYQTVVYHCVDEIKAQPGMPMKEIADAELDLMLRSTVCFVTAEGLLEERRRINAQTYCFPNVADFEHFSKARDPSLAPDAQIAGLPGPRIGFVGAISGYKVDFQLLRKMAVEHPEWSIVLVGKVGEGDPWTSIEVIESVPNIHLVGPRSYSQLPSCLKAFDVGILPSLINDYTRGMFPMKFFEYLAAGLPVVSTALYSLRAHGSVAFIAKDPDAFIEGVEAALRGLGPTLEDRLEVARDQTYERRTDRMLRVMKDATQVGRGNA